MNTTLVSGPTSLNYSKDIKVKKINSGEEMMNEVKKLLPVDIAICAAAVSDFKPINKSKQKIKKDKKKKILFRIREKYRYLRISWKKQ